MFSKLAQATLRRQPLSWRRLLSSTSLQDPSRPDLYYHPVYRNHHPSPSYALSFLPKPPAVDHSDAVLGYLPATSLSEEAAEAGLNDFVHNPGFIELLHRSIRKALENGRDQAISAEALQRGTGWLHIHDSRNIPALGRVGDPDDILGSVRVEEGQVIASTYERMPSYRVCTPDGVTQLSEGLAASLLDELHAQHEWEVNATSPSGSCDAVAQSREEQKAS